MVPEVTANNASEITRHTIFGQIYNKPAPTRDKIMPTNLHLPYYPLLGSYPEGFRAYNSTPPILSLNQNYYGRFAIADQYPVERPLPWDRTWKSQSIG